MPLPVQFLFLLVEKYSDLSSVHVEGQLPVQSILVSPFLKERAHYLVYSLHVFTVSRTGSDFVSQVLSVGLWLVYFTCVCLEALGVNPSLMFLVAVITF